MTNRIYLDTITTTKPSSQAIQQAMYYFEERFGSVSSCHEMGLELFSDMKKYYADIFSLFHAEKQDQFVFTSGGAEAISQIVSSVMKEVVQTKGKNHFIVRAIDEAPAILACSSLEEEACTVSLAKISTHGFMTPDAFIESITPRTAFVSCSLACALTGVLQPIEEIAAIAKKRGILFHIDATHAIGKLALNFHELGCDYLTFNGDQMHALKGTGGLFAKKTAPLIPLIYGENSEKQKRGQALNMPLFASLAQAAIEAKNDEMLYCTEVCRLRDMFEREIEETCPGTQVLFKDEERLPHISCIAFPGIKSEALCYALHKKGVYACMGGGPFQHIERVLDSCGIEKPLSQCALSFSLSKETQESELERAIECIQACVKNLRKTSKVYFGND